MPQGLVLQLDSSGMGLLVDTLFGIASFGIADFLRAVVFIIYAIANQAIGVNLRIDNFGRSDATGYIIPASCGEVVSLSLLEELSSSTHNLLSKMNLALVYREGQ